MALFILIIAGVLEVVWVLGLKYTRGFTRPLPSLITGAAIIGSMLLLSRASRTLPLSVSYAIWVGIGVLGATLGGALLFGEPMPPARLAFIALLVVAVVGLKTTS